VGAQVIFRVAVTSTAPVTCQWQFSGTNLPGANNLSLILFNVQPAQEGDYRVAVSNRFGVTNSEVATLRVLTRPVIVEQPCGQSVVAGGRVTLSVAVTNTAALPIGYRWRKGSTTFAHYLLEERVCFSP